ncbi:MAG: hypothetical protein K5685_03760 [Bacteroidales bacterium]|nr:hypothetical protein [Bacteroidales bacterium]
MKNILMILAIFCSLTAFGQREYTYYNKGINLFLEGEGAGNREFGIGGVAVTFGYQFNPHIFFGGGVALKVGTERTLRQIYDDLGWYDQETNTYHSDYYIDEKGTYHKYQSSSYYTDDCDDGYGFSFMDFFINFRYNVLAQTRYTPYLDIRSGFYTEAEEDSSVFDDVLIGCRFGCGEGDFAITAGAGYSFRRLDYNALNKQQHLFLLRLGVEF